MASKTSNGRGRAWRGPQGPCSSKIKNKTSKEFHNGVVRSRERGHNINGSKTMYDAQTGRVRMNYISAK
jgi:hypothetical protein